MRPSKKQNLGCQERMWLCAKGKGEKQWWIGWEKRSGIVVHLLQGLTLQWLFVAGWIFYQKILESCFTPEHQANFLELKLLIFSFVFVQDCVCILLMCLEIWIRKEEPVWVVVSLSMKLSHCLCSALLSGGWCGSASEEDDGPADRHCGPAEKPTRS